MSTLYVDNLEPRLGSRVMAAGHVVQVQNLTFADTFTQSLTAGAINNLELPITPTSTTSKILIQAHVFFEFGESDHVALWYLLRDSTALRAPVVGNRRSGLSMAGVGFYGDDDASTPSTVYMTYFDSPSTTTEITYKVAVSSDQNRTYAINRSYDDVDSAGFERGVSSITLMEIAQ